MEAVRVQSLPGAVLQQVARAPDAPALGLADGTISYRELRATALGLAARLDELGVARGERLAVGGPKSPATIALVLACLLTGRPALLPAPELRPAALRAVLAEAGIARLVAAEPLAGAVLVEPVAGAAAVDQEPTPDALALLLTTSGSTGLPKVVPLSHEATGRFAAWAGEAFAIGPGDRVLSFCGLHFDLSLLEVWTTLAQGGCAVLVEQERAVHGELLTELIRRHDVQVVQGVPLLYGLLVDAADRHGSAPAGVRHAILTGDTTPPALLARLPELLGGARLWSVYGCTETNDSFVFEVDVDRVLERGAMPLGEAVEGAEALVVSDGQVVRDAGAGELWVSTPFQASGYLGGRARGAFVADPLGRSARSYFRTGDIVRRDAAGELFLQGRTDLHVKVRGQRVNLQAVEQALLEHPDVTEAAVVALEDERAGKRLCARVRIRPPLTALALRTHCAARLARAAVPSIIDAQDGPLPRTPTGKVDREAVRRRAEARAHG